MSEYNYQKIVNSIVKQKHLDWVTGIAKRLTDEDKQGLRIIQKVIQLGGEKKFKEQPKPSINDPMDLSEKGLEAAKLEF